VKPARPASDDYQLIQLAGGVYSLRSQSYGETFHPVIGPAAEAEALYVRQLQLPERLSQHSGEFVIWDVGLGAAANSLTVLRATRDCRPPLRVISFDNTPEPLEFGLRHSAHLGYFTDYDTVVTALLKEKRIHFQDGNHQVTWEFHLADFPGLLCQPATEELPKPHAILFDAFSPAKNPAMWTLSLFKNLFRLLDPQRPCALPTYSRSTMMRTTLLLAGFFVGVGHATGEKEETTIAANSRDLISEPLDRRWLHRARRSHSAEPLHGNEYSIAPLSVSAWEQLQAHPQFQP